MTFRDGPDFNDVVCQFLRAATDGSIGPVVAGFLQEFSIEKQDVVRFKTMLLASVTKPWPVGNLCVYLAR